MNSAFAQLLQGSSSSAFAPSRAPGSYNEGSGSGIPQPPRSMSGESFALLL